MATDSNLALVLKRVGEFVLEETPVPKPGHLEVLIAIHSVGICGSDVHFWNEGRIGDYEVTEPLVLGHESSGTVIKLGEGVTTLKIGDRVAIEPGIPCRKCSYCKEGRYSLCPEERFLSTPGGENVHGSLRQYIVHPEDFCFKLPDNVSLEEGALCEPLSVGIHACRRGNVQYGHNILICGAGPIGLMSMLAAKAFGAVKVCVTDISDSRLEFAKTVGADCVLNVRGLAPKDAAKSVAKKLGNMPNVTIECSGSESAVQLAIYATKTGGTVTLIGFNNPFANVPVTEALVRELTITTGFRYYNTYPTAVSMMASGKVKSLPLISHHFPLSKGAEAFELAKSGAGIKVVVDCYRKD